MPYFTVDIACPSCGYNLRGLSLAHGCPECGLKIVSPELPAYERGQREQIEAEVEQNLRQMEQENQRQEQIDDLLGAWEKRGERFDRLLDRIERALDRCEGAGDR